MKDIICIKCLNKEQVSKDLYRVKCSSCGFELNVEEAAILANCDNEAHLFIKEKVKKIETTDDFDLSYKISKLNFPRYVKETRELFELALSKDNIKALYEKADYYITLADTYHLGDPNGKRFSQAAYDIYIRLIKLGETLPYKKILLFGKMNTTTPIYSVSGWKGPMTTRVELEDVIQFDSHLAFLRDITGIKIILKNMKCHTHGLYRNQEEYSINCLIVNDDVTYIDNAVFPSVNTLVYLGTKGFPTLNAFKNTKPRDVVFINSGFLSGKNFLVEGCTYIMNKFETFNDKENFITTLSKKTDKMFNLIKDIIVKEESLNCTKFLIDNNIVKYDLLLECLNENISDEKKMLILDATNNTSLEEKTNHVKHQERKTELDLGIESYTIKDLKEDYTCSKKGDTIKITKYSGKDVDLIIPSNVDGCTSFEIEGFGKNDNVSTIIFENGITSISLGKETKFGVFHYLKNLKKIILPQTLTNIDARLFNSLNTNVVVEVNKETGLLKEVDGLITFDDKLIFINNRDTIKKIIVPNYVKKILDLNLENSLVETIEIPNNVETIGNINCLGCSCLNKVLLPDSIKVLNDSAFEECYKLKEIKLPSNLISIGSNCFKSCWELDNVNLPATLEEINDKAFYVCKKLSEVNFPQNIKYIGASAFGWCTSLTSLNIPKTIDIINRSTFKGCKNITSLIIPSNIKTISKKAFYECIRITSITIEDGLKTIGEGAFEECRKLKTLNIPKTVEEIPYTICMSCSKLEITVEENEKQKNWCKNWNDISKANRPYSW
ncbi:MAG: leucine-rich repeat protein [bacterium]